MGDINDEDDGVRKADRARRRRGLKSRAQRKIEKELRARYDLDVIGDIVADERRAPMVEVVREWLESQGYEDVKVEVDPDDGTALLISAKEPRTIQITVTIR